MAQGILLGVLLLPATSRAQESPRDPMVLSVNLASLVPIDAQGSLEELGLGLALETQKGTTLGLRVSMEVASIPTVTESDAEGTWSAMLEGRRMFGTGYRADLFISTSAGFLMGARYCEGESNLVQPHGRLGFGLQLLSKPKATGKALSLSPEMGLLPGVFYDNGPLSIAGFYSGVQLAWILPD